MSNQQPAPFIFRLALLIAGGLALLVAVLPTGAAAQAPAAVSILAQRFSNVPTPGPTFDLVQSTIDFAPGASSFEVTAAAPHYVGAVEGDLVADFEGAPHTIAAGKSIAVPVGVRLIIRNPSMDKTTRSFISSLLPAGTLASVHQLSGPGVAIFATSRLTMSGAPATVDIVQSGARYDVGYKSSVHTMNQPHLMTHIEGLTRYVYLDGLQESYTPPSQGEMYVGRAGYMFNAGSDPSAFLMTWVSAAGAPPLTTAVNSPAAVPPSSPAAVAPQPPNTGTGFAPVVAASTFGLTAWALVLLCGAAALVVAGVQRSGRP